jgi:hypothetical protein
VSFRNVSNMSKCDVLRSVSRSARLGRQLLCHRLVFVLTEHKDASPLYRSNRQQVPRKAIAAQCGACARRGSRFQTNPSCCGQKRW